MWKLPMKDRLDRWKRLRLDINEIDSNKAFAQVSEFWSTAPFTPYYLDADNPETWPDPWTLIAENYYCDLAKALGIVYTIHLSSHGANHNIGIKVFLDEKTKGQYNLVWIDDGKYVLNFAESEIVNRTQLPVEFKLLAEFSSQDLKLNNY